MKTLIWLLFALLLAVWTGGVWLVLGLSEWLLSAAASAQPGAGVGVGVADVLGSVGQWPLPAWLAPWLDATALQAWQAQMAAVLQWLGGVLPSATSLVAWLSPLALVVWGLVALLLLAMAAVAHWVVGQVGGANGGGNGGANGGGRFSTS